MFSNRQKGMESRAQVEGLTSDRRTATSSVKISMLYWKHMLAVELMCVCVCVCVSRSVVSSLCDPVDCSTPDSMGLSRQEYLEWVSISFSRASSRIRDQTCVSCIGRRILYHWVTREAPFCLFLFLHFFLLFHYSMMGFSYFLKGPSEYLLIVTSDTQTDIRCCVL